MIAYIRYDLSSKEITAISHLPFDGCIIIDMDDELFEKVFNNPTFFVFNDNLIVQKEIIH